MEDSVDAKTSCVSSSSPSMSERSGAEHEERRELESEDFHKKLLLGDEAASSPKSSSCVTCEGSRNR